MLTRRASTLLVTAILTALPLSAQRAAKSVESMGPTDSLYSETGFTALKGTKRVCLIDFSVNFVTQSSLYGTKRGRDVDKNLGMNRIALGGLSNEALQALTDKAEQIFQKEFQDAGLTIVDYSDFAVTGASPDFITARIPAGGEDWNVSDFLKTTAAETGAEVARTFTLGNRPYLGVESGAPKKKTNQTATQMKAALCAVRLTVDFVEYLSPATNSYSWKIGPWGPDVLSMDNVKMNCRPKLMITEADVVLYPMSGDAATAKQKVCLASSREWVAGVERTSRAKAGKDGFSEFRLNVAGEAYTTSLEELFATYARQLAKSIAAGAK